MHIHQYQIFHILRIGEFITHTYQIVGSLLSHISGRHGEILRFQNIPDGVCRHDLLRIRLFIGLLFLVIQLCFSRVDLCLPQIQLCLVGSNLDGCGNLLCVQLGKRCGNRGLSRCYLCPGTFQLCFCTLKLFLSGGHFFLCFCNLLFARIQLLLLLRAGINGGLQRGDIALQAYLLGDQLCFFIVDPLLDGIQISIRGNAKLRQTCFQSRKACLCLSLPRLRCCQLTLKLCKLCHILGFLLLRHHGKLIIRKGGRLDGCFQLLHGCLCLPGSVQPVVWILTLVQLFCLGRQGIQCSDAAFQLTEPLLCLLHLSRQGIQLFLGIRKLFFLSIQCLFLGFNLRKLLFHLLKLALQLHLVFDDLRLAGGKLLFRL